MRTTRSTVFLTPLRIAAVVAGAVAFASAARAQTWDGGLSHGNFTVNNLWSTANNWVGGAPPVSSINTDLAFATSGAWTTATQNMASPFVLHSITFDSTNANFTGIDGLGLDFHNNASSSAPLINQNCGVAITLANAINLTNSLLIQGGGSGSLSLSGPLSGAGNLTKGGNFALTLGADNTSYAGGVTISGGSIVLGNANALAGSTVAVNVNNGLNVNGQASPTLGALAGTGNIAAGSTATVFTVGANNASTTYSGAFTGSATDFVMAGTGTLTLTGKGSSVHGLDVTNGSVVLDSGGTFAATSTAGGNSPRRAIEVGNSSNATSLIVQGGSTLDTSAGQEVVVGLSAAAQTMTIQGTGTLWKLPAQTDIGGGGPGTLTIQNGAQAIGGTFFDMGNSGSGTIQILSGGQVTTNSVFAAFGGSGVLTISGANSSLNANVVVLANNGGTDTGTLKVTAGGAATMNGLQISSLSSSVTIDGGTLSTNTVTELSGYTGPIVISDPVGGSALTIGSGNGSSTVAGPITDAGSGPGTVVKAGTGTLTLTGHLTNTGGYKATGGTIDFNGALVQPQFGSLTAPSGSAIKYDNSARVIGGLLVGPGTHLVNGASFTGTTASNSAVISVTGAATFANFSNGGALSVAAGLSQTPNFSSFINEGSGSITIGAVNKVNVSDFQSYGVLTLNPATVGSGQITELVNTGSSPLSFNGGSRTFIGTPATATMNGQPTFVAGIDLHGQNAILAGGLLVNNGFVGDSSNNGAGTATVIADFGALVKGAGFFQNPVITQNGGKFQAGNSPGLATFGSFVLGPGGVNNYVFAINDATGMAGPSPDANGQVSCWGLVRALAPPVGGRGSNGDFAWTATATDRLTVDVETLINPTTVGTDIAGPMADFDPSRSYVWPAVQWSGSYSGPSDAAVLNADTSFDTSGVVNPIAGTFGWSLRLPNQTLSLSYTPTAAPEPGTLALLGVAAGGLLIRRRLWAAR